MSKLRQLSQSLLEKHSNLPFALYSSLTDQHLLNVPIANPLLILVLQGVKQIKQNEEISCVSGNFIFLSNSPNVSMRNLARDGEYLALLMEFKFEDFDTIKPRKHAQQYITGTIDPLLEYTIEQFVEWSAVAPPELWGLRRREILSLLCQLGYEDILSMIQAPSMTHTLHNLISERMNGDVSVPALCDALAMSESNLRRKLKLEGSSIQSVKDSARLSYGLNILQTTFEPIGRVAERCGYQSQSRFTDRFKQMFGLTPSELRKTRMAE